MKNPVPDAPKASRPAATPLPRGILLASLLCATAARTPAQVSITDPGQDVYTYTATMSELSGLAWLEGTTYYAVSDETSQRKVHELAITLNPANGRVTAVVPGQAITLAAGYDLEGIAYCRPRGTWFISDEGPNPAGGYLREHTFPAGGLVRTVAVPSVMLNERSNFGFESCSWGAGALWTANEEALAHESGLSTASSGSLIRLQRFDHQFEPAGQWAYQTDSFGYNSSLTTAERSGVSDLLALPDGTLLVLERALGIGFAPSYRIRIYRVGFTGATDTSGIADLDDTPHTPVTKTLLWEKNMGSVSTRNFEGIALGPALPQIGNDCHSLLLVADNGGGSSQHLYALVARGLIAPPPVAGWRQGFWGSTAATGSAAPDADPDQDGVPNLLEYALGGIPTTAERSPLVGVDGTSDRLTLHFSRNVAYTDITITVEATDDLAATWTPIARSVAGGPVTVIASGATVAEEQTGAVRAVAVGDLYPINDPANPRRFLRVRVTLP